MTVGELIEKLEEFPEEAEVFVDIGERITNVYLDDSDIEDIVYIDTDCLADWEGDDDD